MPTDMPLSRDVLNDVRGACETTGRPTTDAEVERALAPLSEDQLDAVHRLARTPHRAGPLGPEALVDMASGTPAVVASAREVGGYYAMKAERDALAQLAQARAPRAAPTAPTAPAPTGPAAAAPSPAQIQAPARLAPAADRSFAAARPVVAAAPAAEPEDEAPARAPVAFEKRDYAARQQELVTLFAYHRDAVRVAQELGLGMAELTERVEALGLKRRIHRLLEATTDIEVFSPERVGRTRGEVRTAPVLRKRSDKVERAEPELEPEPERAPERSGPAAVTEPVNQHGTRVYRRTELPPAREAPTNNLAVRREYVREPRRQERAPRPAPARVEAPVAVPARPARRPYSDLQGRGGAEILERLIADEKANPRVLAGKLAERFEGPADREITDSDLRMLLAHHSLAITFYEREIVNTRFLIGFHQGARTKLANALLLSTEELPAYLTRLELDGELERTRQERARIELGRKRLHDRIVQVLTRAPYLDDLGVLPTIDRDVREQLEALFREKAAGAVDPAGLEQAVREELQLEPNAFAKLLRRYELGELASTTLTGR